MDRKALREFTHKAENFLSIENTAYKQWVFRYTFLELEKDLGVRGDITTRSVFKYDRRVKAKIVAREAGILAGVHEIKYFLVDSNSNFKPKIFGEFEVNFMFKDGDSFEVGDVLLEISAGVYDLLAAERVVLNLLMRMSGVATFTRKIVDLVHDCDVLIVPTRKTLWGLLDKRAVVVGGGGTHRINLSDAILVKDNHIDFFDGDIGKIFQNIADSDFGGRFVEFEARNVDEVMKIAGVFAEFLDLKKIRSIGVILMDNMCPSDVSSAISQLRATKLYDNLLFEASGGISAENVEAYAKTGVDIISMGCLTSGCVSLDLGMEV